MNKKRKINSQHERDIYNQTLDQLFLARFKLALENYLKNSNNLDNKNYILSQLGKIVEKNRLNADLFCKFITNIKNKSILKSFLLILGDDFCTSCIKIYSRMASELEHPTLQWTKCNGNNVDFLMSTILNLSSIYDKRIFENENLMEIQNELLNEPVTLGAKIVPSEIIFYILNYLDKNRELLDSVGIVNYNFHIKTLYSFKKIKINQNKKHLTPKLVFLGATTAICLLGTKNKLLFLDFNILSEMLELKSITLKSLHHESYVAEKIDSSIFSKIHFQEKLKSIKLIDFTKFESTLFINNNFKRLNKIVLSNIYDKLNFEENKEWILKLKCLKFVFSNIGFIFTVNPLLSGCNHDFIKDITCFFDNAFKYTPNELLKLSLIKDKFKVFKEYIVKYLSQYLINIYLGLDSPSQNNEYRWLTTLKNSKIYYNDFSNFLFLKKIKCSLIVNANNFFNTSNNIPKVLENLSFSESLEYLELYLIINNDQQLAAKLNNFLLLLKKNYSKIKQIILHSDLFRKKFLLPEDFSEELKHSYKISSNLENIDKLIENEVDLEKTKTIVLAKYPPSFLLNSLHFDSNFLNFCYLKPKRILNKSLLDNNNLPCIKEHCYIPKNYQSAMHHELANVNKVLINKTRKSKLLFILTYKLIPNKKCNKTEQIANLEQKKLQDFNFV